MIPARWAVAAPPDPQLTAALASDLHIPEPLAALLVQRGLAAPELAKAFLRPDLERLSDPHAWADMPRAVELVVAAVRAGTPILVHGDYDVDGQCAAALLTRVLSSVGGRVHAFVPHRLRDGYDFGPAGLAEARRLGAGLIITCDCGITAVEVVRAARAAGIEVIVTDHHLPGDELPPASAVLDPQRTDCRSAAKELCGTGVAFKLAQALVPALGLSPHLPLHFLDLVALATVADVLPPEDRALVLAADAWHPGVIGIVASRLVERYGRPTFLIGWEEGSEVGRGSGRSVAGFDLHAALHRVGHHLEKYGGHTMAAGLTIRRERYDAFRVAFLAVAGELLGPDDLVPAQRVDLELPLGLVSDELEKLIRYLEPCGPGNPAPVFGVRQARAVGARRVGTNHLRFTLDDASGALPAIAFQWADAIPDHWLAERLDVAFRLERDEWQGRTTLQARVAAMAPSV